MNQNTSIDVLISTAGSGTRMHEISNDLHKSLIPYENIPILFNLIFSFHDQTQIYILLGHKSDQIRNSISLAFPEKKITFIYVDDWLSPKSGTAYSLKFAKEYLSESFWYFPCDGIYKNYDFLNIETSEDIFVVSPISENSTEYYQTFNLENNRIIKKFFKEKNISNAYAFTGAMRIHNRDKFFESLEKSDSVEFVEVIPFGGLTYLTNSWLDLGNAEMYKSYLSTKKNFDFTKIDEFTFELPKQIIKWWADEMIPEKKFQRYKQNHKVYPSNVKVIKEFLSYDLAPGICFYQNINPSNFLNFLYWLRDNLWIKSDIDLKVEVKEFYQNKTLDRIELLGLKKRSPSYNPKIIDGTSVMSWEYYLNKIDWEFITENYYSAYIHGDLQFDNVIYSEMNKKFTLIDWRPSFADSIHAGDIYYDFAKMLGGIYLNYAEIKLGRFEFDFDNGRSSISMKLPSVNFQNELIEILKNFSIEMGLDFKKVQILVPIIYWNMAPLHKEPFGNLCWAMGIKLFDKLENSE